MAATNEGLVQRNAEYAPSHKSMPYIEELIAMGGGRPEIAIFTCADPRVFAETFLGLQVGEAVIFRTVAGHPQPVLEDLAALDVEFESSLKHAMIIYHTDCGSLRFQVPKLEKEFEQRQPGFKSHLGQCTPFGAVDKSNVDEHIRNDVEWLKAHPLMRKGQGITIGGYLFDIKTGKLRQVV